MNETPGSQLRELTPLNKKDNLRRQSVARVVDDAGGHQIGDAVSDRPRMHAEPLFAAERAGYGFGNRAETKLDRRAIGNQPGHPHSSAPAPRCREWFWKQVDAVATMGECGTASERFR